jgi:hypothetical protein
MTRGLRAEPQLDRRFWLYVSLGIVVLVLLMLLVVYLPPAR